MLTFVLGGMSCSSLSDQCDIIPQTITVAGNLMERAVGKLARWEPKCAYSGDLVGDVAGRGTSSWINYFPVVCLLFTIFVFFSSELSSVGGLPFLFR